MNCTNCDEEKEGLGECIACKEFFCEDCFVGMKAPPHPMIDYNLCNGCDGLIEEINQHPQ